MVATMETAMCLTMVLHGISMQTYLWWRHMGWNPNVDGIMLSIAKSKKRHILGSWWWSVPIISLVLWIFSMYICLFAPIMCTMCFYFLWCLFCCCVFVGCISCGMAMFAWVSWWMSIKDLEEIKRIKGQ